MADHTARPRRLDLHNVTTNADAADAGRYGFTHLATGRICQLPHRHRGPCQLHGHATALSGSTAGVVR